MKATLTEAQLQQVIYESAKRIIKENETNEILGSLGKSVGKGLSKAGATLSKNTAKVPGSVARQDLHLAQKGLKGFPSRFTRARGTAQNVGKLKQMIKPGSEVGWVVKEPKSVLNGKIVRIAKDGKSGEIYDAASKTWKAMPKEAQRAFNSSRIALNNVLKSDRAFRNSALLNKALAAAGIGAGVAIANNGEDSTEVTTNPSNETPNDGNKTYPWDNITPIPTTPSKPKTPVPVVQQPTVDTPTPTEPIQNANPAPVERKPMPTIDTGLAVPTSNAVQQTTTNNTNIPQPSNNVGNKLNNPKIARLQSNGASPERIKRVAQRNVRNYNKYNKQ